MAELKVNSGHIYNWTWSWQLWVDCFCLLSFCSSEEGTERRQGHPPRIKQPAVGKQKPGLPFQALHPPAWTFSLLPYIWLMNTLHFLPELRERPSPLSFNHTRLSALGCLLSVLLFPIASRQLPVFSTLFGSRRQMGRMLSAMPPNVKSGFQIGHQAAVMASGQMGSESPGSWYPAWCVAACLLAFDYCSHRAAAFPTLLEQTVI